MTEHTRLALAMTFTFLIAGGSFAFFGWFLWSLFWDVFDHLMQRYKRIENNLADELARESQFHIPSAFRDMKGVQR